MLFTEYLRKQCINHKSSHYILKSIYYISCSTDITTLDRSSVVPSQHKLHPSVNVCNVLMHAKKAQNLYHTGAIPFVVPDLPAVVSGMISSKLRLSCKILCQLFLGLPWKWETKNKVCVLGMILLFWDIPEILICSAGTVIAH